MERIVALLRYAETLKGFMDYCGGSQEEAIFDRFTKVCNEIEKELKIN